MARPSDTTLTKRLQRAYLLRVKLRGQPKSIPGVDGMRDGLWVFPRHPQSVQYEAQGRTFNAPQGATERMADEQGVDPPNITVAGTFGERGGYDPSAADSLDGRAATRALEALIRGYLKLNAEAGRKRQPLYTLEWLDTYKGEYWVVTPQLVPYGAEDASAPYRESYQLRLVGLTRVDDPPKPASPLKGKLLGGHTACPLRPNCQYGGPFVTGCPFRS